MLVLVLLGGAAAAYRFDLGERWFGAEQPDPVREPAAVAAARRALEVPPLARPAPVAEAGGAGRALRAAVRRALAPGLRDRDLGPSVHAYVAPLDGGRGGVRVGQRRVRPRLVDQARHRRRRAGRAGARPPVHHESSCGRRGALTLVGGGDPFLGPGRRTGRATGRRAPTSSTSPEQTAQSLREERWRRPVRLSYDDSLFTGPSDNPAWQPDYVPDDIVSPISALWVDEGLDPGPASGGSPTPPPARPRPSPRRCATRA